MSEFGDTAFLEKDIIMMGKVAEVISAEGRGGELLFSCLPTTVMEIKRS